MSRRLKRRLNRVVGALGIFAAILCASMIFTAGRPEQNRQWQWIVFGLLLFIVSLILYIRGGLPFRDVHHNELKLRVAFYGATLSLVIALLQLPLWIYLTGAFPPEEFDAGDKWVATVGVIVSLIGPALPWLVRSRRTLDTPHVRRRHHDHARGEPPESEQALPPDEPQ